MTTIISNYNKPTKWIITRDQCECNPKTQYWFKHIKEYYVDSKDRAYGYFHCCYGNIWTFKTQIEARTRLNKTLAREMKECILTALKFGNHPFIGDKGNFIKIITNTKEEISYIVKYGNFNEQSQIGGRIEYAKYKVEPVVW